MSAAVSGRRLAAANNLTTLSHRTAVVTAWVAAAVAVSACGDNHARVDAMVDVPPCAVTITNYGAIQSFTQTTAHRATDGSGKVTVAFLGALAAGPDADTLDIQLIQGMGAFTGGPPAAGTYQLTGAETQLSTCGVCVVLEGGTPRSYFAAQSGTLVITDVSTTFQASLSNVELAHVNVDQATSVSTIADTCTTTITSASWQTPIN